MRTASPSGEKEHGADVSQHALAKEPDAVPGHMGLGILVAAQHTFGRQVIRGILEYCRDHDPWDIQVESGYSEYALGQLLKVISHWKSKAIIAEFWWPEQFRAVAHYDAPVVEVCGAWTGAGLPQVIPDYHAVGRLIAQHFMERGLRQFASFGVRRGHSSVESEAGFGQELRREGHDCTHYYDPKTRGRSQDPQGDRRALAAWLHRQEKPLGLMCFGDHRAREALRACQAIGLHVPEEVAIVGMNNDELTCDISSIPLSSVDVAGVHIGRAAAELVDHLRRGGAPPDHPVLIAPVGVVVRQSSDVMATENPEVSAALRYINQHAGEPIDVRNVLAHIPISRRGLEKSFRKLLGRTPRQQIFHAHVRLAQRILVETTLPLAAVAERAGFSGHSTFSIVFRRQTGLTPREFRSRFR